MTMSRVPFLAAVVIASGITTTAAAAPINVTVVGSLQSELGCASDWDPACALTDLSFDATDNVWEGSFALPMGNYEYKVAIDHGWDENYGQHAVLDGANISLSLATATTVKFYYSDATHWVTDNVNSEIVVAPGSFQSELGCSGDWQPDCLRAWLQDPDGDGIYVMVALLPPGTYETKAALSESWDVHYGLGGVLGGANIGFTVPTGTFGTRFQYDSDTHILTVDELTSAAVPEPASWLLVSIGGAAWAARRRRVVRPTATRTKQ